MNSYGIYTRYCKGQTPEKVLLYRDARGCLRTVPVTRDDPPTIEERLDRLELAVATMAQWLVQAQTGFNANDAQGIERILAGKTPRGPKEV